MSLAASIPSAILDTVLGWIAPLLLTGAAGDLILARQAAHQMLAAYDLETEEELRLAGEIISFGFHALEALSQATDPDLSLNQVLRHRGSAVSLSRESHKSQRKLDQLQRARRSGIPVQPTEADPEILTTPTRPQIDEAIGLIEFAREAMESANKNGGKTWTQLLNQRHTAKRIADKAKKKQAQHIRRAAHAHTPPQQADQSLTAA